MSEFEKHRLSKQNKWTPAQLLSAALEDVERNEVDQHAPGAKCVQIAVMCVVEQKDKTRNLVTYSAGFDNIPEELGYMTMFIDKLQRWWRGE